MGSLCDPCFEGRDKDIGVRRETMEMGELALLGQLSCPLRELCTWVAVRRCKVVGVYFM